MSPGSATCPLLVVVSIAVAMATLGCDSVRGKSDVKIDGVLVAQASGNAELEEGPTITLVAGQRPDEVALPEGQVVRLAMARDVTYRAAREMIARVEQAGKRPVVLVGDRHKLRAMKLNDELEDARTAIRLVATPDGKACVAPPDNPESRCVQPQYSRHISTAFVREFVRDAVNGYGLHEVRVFARPSMEWADVVRAVDGARTCCDGKVIPRVRLSDAGDDPLAPAPSGAAADKAADRTSAPAPMGTGVMGVPPESHRAGEAAADEGDEDEEMPAATGE